MNSGVVQVDTRSSDDSKKYKVVGRINSTVIQGGSNWVMLKYRYGDEYRSHCKQSAMSNKNSRRQAHIMMVCDPSETQVYLKSYSCSSILVKCYWEFEFTEFPKKKMWFIC